MSIFLQMERVSLLLGCFPLDIAVL